MSLMYGPITAQYCEYIDQSQLSIHRAVLGQHGVEVDVGLGRHLQTLVDHHGLDLGWMKMSTTFR